jgi:hypothetical protein
MPRLCNRCLKKVSFKNVSQGYFAYCKTSDEDLYLFETHKVSKLRWLGILLKVVR